MKVKDAQRIFSRWGESISVDFDALIRQKKKVAPQEGMRNDNYYHALFFTDYMFRSTEHYLKMLSGSQGDGFLSVLKKSFEDALKRITRNRQGEVQIILVNCDISQSLQLMMDRYPALSVTLAKSAKNENVSHTIICDEYMVREEEPHKELTGDSDVRAIKAKVFFNNKDRAKIASESFDSIWKRLNGMIDD